MWGSWRSSCPSSGFSSHGILHGTFFSLHTFPASVEAAVNGRHGTIEAATAVPPLPWNQQKKSIDSYRGLQTVPLTSSVQGYKK